MIRLLAVIVLLATYGGQSNEPPTERATSNATRLPPHGRHARRHFGPTPPDALTGAASAAMAPMLEPSERVQRAVAAVGCTLVLTDRRLAVVRDGASFRPRSGVKLWPLDRELTLRLGPPRRDTSRLVIDHSGRSASVFLTAAQVEDARALVAVIRQRIYADE
jgi:hypothetical protein